MINFSTISSENEAFGEVLILDGISSEILIKSIKTGISSNVCSWVIDSKDVFFNFIIFKDVNYQIIKTYEIPNFIIDDFKKLVGVSFYANFDFKYAEIGYLKEDANGVFSKNAAISKTIPVNGIVQDFYPPQILLQFSLIPQDGVRLEFKIFDSIIELYPNSRYLIDEFDENQFSTNCSLFQMVENLKQSLLLALDYNEESFLVSGIKNGILITSSYVNPYSYLDFTSFNITGANDFCTYSVEKNGFNDKVVILDLSYGTPKLKTLLGDKGVYQLINSLTFKSETDNFSFVNAIRNDKYGSLFNFGINSIYQYKTPSIRDYADIANINNFNGIFLIDSSDDYKRGISYFKDNQITVNGNFDNLNICCLNQLSDKYFVTNVVDKTINIVILFPFLETNFDDGKYPKNVKVFQILNKIVNWQKNILTLDSKIWWLKNIGSFDITITLGLNQLKINNINSDLKFDNIKLNGMLLKNSSRLSRIQYPIISSILKNGIVNIETRFTNLTESIFNNTKILKVSDSIVVNFKETHKNYYLTDPFTLILI